VTWSVKANRLDKKGLLAEGTCEKEGIEPGQLGIIVGKKFYGLRKSTVEPVTGIINLWFVLGQWKGALDFLSSKLPARNQDCYVHCI